MFKMPDTLIETYALEASSMYGSRRKNRLGRERIEQEENRLAGDKVGCRKPKSKFEHLCICSECGNFFNH